MVPRYIDAVASFLYECIAFIITKLLQMFPSNKRVEQRLGVVVLVLQDVVQFVSRVLEGEEEPQRSSFRDGGVLLGLDRREVVVVLIIGAGRLARGPPARRRAAGVVVVLARGPLRRGLLRASSSRGVRGDRSSSSPLGLRGGMAALWAAHRLGVPAAWASDAAVEQPYGAVAARRDASRLPDHELASRRSAAYAVRGFLLKLSRPGRAGRAERSPRGGPLSGEL